MNRSNVPSRLRSPRDSIKNLARSTAAKATATGTGLTVFAGSALASGGTSPGSALAEGLAGMSTEMGLVFAALAVGVALLVVWAFTRRAANK